MKPKQLNCPVCGHQFDDFMQVGGKKYTGPQPGSLGVCIECGDVHTWLVTGGVRSLSATEYARALEKYPNLRHALSALKQAKEEEERDAAHGI